MNGDELYQTWMNASGDPIGTSALRPTRLIATEEWLRVLDQETNPWCDYRQQQQRQYDEDMKRKLTGDQFGNRYPLIEPGRLAYALQEYAHDLAHDTNRSRLLLTEIPLRHELIKRPHLPPGRDEDIIVTLLRGYRIYRVQRSKPNDPQLLAIFSRMTKCWHRVGFADLNQTDAMWGGRERWTVAGCSSLADEMLGQGPDSVPDNALLRCLIVDLLPADYRYYVGLLARRAWDNSSWCLGEAMKKCGLTLDPATPSPVALARILNSDKASCLRIWEVIDRYGFPDGPLGETLGHMDKFRTF